MTRLITIMLLSMLYTQVAVAQSRFSLGAEYSEGEYGTDETTRAWYIPLGWHYRNANLKATLTIPWLIVEGAAEVTYEGRRLSMSGTGGGGSGGGSASTSRSASGLGDILAAVGYLLLPEGAQRPWLAATAKVKFGTASESKGLGTGENDYALQLDAGKGMFAGYAGYKWLGDTSSVDYDNVAYFGLTLSQPIAPRQGVEASYYQEQASLPGMDDIKKVKLSLDGASASGLGYSLYYVAGLSDSTAERVIGFTISSRLP